MVTDIQAKQSENNIKSALEEYEKGKVSRNETVMLRGKPELCPVINLDLDTVYLNQQNHRLTAQLSDYQGDKSILNDPKSELAQSLIRELLSKTEEFSNLKEELKAYKQKDPGVVTREGLLVNGNTRCAALMELRKEGINNGIDVAVLPSWVQESDILDLEMNLQMLKLTHQKYTFTNELLFMKQYYEKTNSKESLAKHMGWRRQGLAKVNKHLEVLNYIEEVRHMSSTPIGYSIFDTKANHLFDLYTTINSKEYQSDPVAQEQVKNKRLLGIFLGLNKDQVREIPSEFLDDIIEISAGNKSNLEFLKEYQTNENIVDELIDDDSETEFDAGKLLKDFLHTPGMVSEKGELAQDFEGKFADLANEMKRETDRRVKIGRQETRNQELHTTVRSVTSDLRYIRDALPDKIGMKGFKKADFEFELDKAKEEIEELINDFSNLKS